ncbi:VasL domain-containing protein [Kluyvera intermedia]|uniref:VasL domain-containing protein n=1 Tax=Kluyvera intermedia TaxID=61648 RepID=UPI0035237363
MHDEQLRQVRTGGDPRSLSEFMALRDELNKLTHPARPDVNWRYVEKLCLSLFEQNGVELQTAAWYTLARTQLAGLFGLNEGLAIIEALISHQWGTLWPQPVHARMEILASLSQRLQQVMRTLSFTYTDLGKLYQAEQHLSGMGGVLQRLELKHVSQLDTLRGQLHNAAVRLENNEASGKDDTFLPLSGPLARNTTENPVILRDSDDLKTTVRRIYVARSEPAPGVEVLVERLRPASPWKVFSAGMLTMLVVATMVVAGWWYLHQPDPLQTQLSASLNPLPTTLTSAQLQALQQKTLSSVTVINQTRQQLTRLASLSPDWSIAYGNQLVQQIQALWPEQSEPLVKQWQQLLDAGALPEEQLNGWHQGMMQLQQLTDKLNALDEHKGRYLTGSELKTMVYDITRSFNRVVPAEEQLRQLSKIPEGQPLPDAQQSQVEQHLKQLNARYARVTQNQPE